MRGLPQARERHTRAIVPNRDAHRHTQIPDEELREQLWRAHLPADLPRADDLDLADLARRYEFTGGSVRNCAVRAAFLAAAERQPLSQEHLRRAIRLEYRAAGKLAEGGPLE